jgi:hypothetical protein
VIIKVPYVAVSASTVSIYRKIPRSPLVAHRKELREISAIIMQGTEMKRATRATDKMWKKLKIEIWKEKNLM